MPSCSTARRFFPRAAGRGEGIDFSIKSGEETGIEEGCSIVSARLSVNEKTLGSAGVIGPVRMDYRKVIKVLEHINTLVAKVLSDDGEE